eukprot:120151-Prymnesium_polylepis.1
MQHLDCSFTLADLFVCRIFEHALFDVTAVLFLEVADIVTKQARRKQLHHCKVFLEVVLQGCASQEHP